MYANAKLYFNYPNYNRDDKIVEIISAFAAICILFIMLETHET